MPTDLHRELRRAANEPTHGPDIPAAIRRGDQLRRRQRTAVVAVGLTAIAALGLGVTVLPATDPAPEIGAPAATEIDDGWDVLTSGSLDDGQQWVLTSRTTDDALCLRWEVAEADRGHVCADDINWSSAERDHGEEILLMTSADPELVFGYVGPSIASVQVTFTDATQVHAELYTVPGTDFHAYVAQTGGRDIQEVTGHDADGQHLTSIDDAPR